MGLLDRIAKRFASSYTDAVVDAIVSRAGGSTAPRVSQTGGLEIAAGLVGRAFATAQVENAEDDVTAALTPRVLMMVGRELIRTGEAVLAIQIARGELDLLPCSTWDITGDAAPRSWLYRVDLASPTGSSTRTLPADGVIHCQYSFAPDQPWLGVAPLQVASGTGRLLSEAEKALADESATPRGYVLPLPSEGDSTVLQGLRASLKTLDGKLATVETTQGAWPGSKDAAPSGDWRAMRLGANPPGSLVELRRDALRTALSAAGIPDSLTERSDGTAMREGWRQMLFGLISPIGRVVEHELRLKLDAPELSLTWSELRASDLSGRARAFASLVKSGMELERAAALSGLLQE